jgi:hypothetical protein
VVQTVTSGTGRDGRTIQRTNSYREIATGMHYQENGEWKGTKPLIQSFDRGAIARFGPHKVIFANNLNTAGAIDVQTRDGKNLRSHVLGLAYFDSSNGKSVLIAGLKDSLGQIVGSNTVVYPEVFSGVKADVRFTYRRSGLEQDVILRSQPPSPKNWGLNPETSRLEVWTEFLNPSEPRKQRRGKAGVNAFEDQDLKFRAMRWGAGKAFSNNESAIFQAGFDAMPDNATRQKSR